MSAVQWPVTTQRLVLRPHRGDDLAWLVKVYSRPDVARFLLDDPWTPHKAEEALAKRLSRTDLDGETGALAVVIEVGQTPIGDVALWFTDREHRCAEIGWVLDPEHGGHGYAREAVGAIIDIGFDAYGLHRVVAQMDARNTASSRLAAAVGMRREAHHLQDYWSKGEWTDSLIYALLATDPR